MKYNLKQWKIPTHTPKLHPHFLTGAALLAASALLRVAASHITGFADWYAHTIYPILVGIIGRISAIFPFSVVEIGLYSLIFLSVVYVIRFFRQPLRLISRTVLLIGILLFSYMVNCGINYYAMPFSSYAGLETGLYTKEELQTLCEFLVQQVNANVSEDTYRENRREWKQESVRAMENAAQEYPCLGGYYPRPKEVAVSEILSVQQLCGIYSPFTIEANFNGDMPNYNVPHTMCHELSHLKGFMREDEANFIGYLACISSEHQAFRYSGYLTGWVYAGNALASVDAEAYTALWKQLDPRAVADLNANNQFWNQYEGKVAEAANKWNDTYLKMNDQEDGVRSYGRMVDLMIAIQKKIEYN